MPQYISYSYSVSSQPEGPESKPFYTKLSLYCEDEHSQHFGYARDQVILKAQNPFTCTRMLICVKSLQGDLIILLL